MRGVWNNPKNPETLLVPFILTTKGFLAKWNIILYLGRKIFGNTLNERIFLRFIFLWLGVFTPSLRRKAKVNNINPWRRYVITQTPCFSSVNCFKPTPLWLCHITSLSPTHPPRPPTPSPRYYHSPLYWATKYQITSYKSALAVHSTPDFYMYLLLWENSEHDGSIFHSLWEDQN